MPRRRAKVAVIAAGVLLVSACAGMPAHPAPTIAGVGYQFTRRALANGVQEIRLQLDVPVAYSEQVYASMQAAWRAKARQVCDGDFVAGEMETEITVHSVPRGRFERSPDTANALSGTVRCGHDR
jgi:hypothetical protein